ncbi:MAG: RluA family pseudouridine synthase [Candidatus Hydrogenedentes bacterium]|nr:RluA family pseudouridine synthase [Candidatus Hydrogenedentota bacterium]
MPPNLFEDIVVEAYEKYRLDVYLADEIEDASRSFIKKLIKEGRVTVNGGVCTRPGRTMTAGDKVTVDIPPPPSTDILPENIPLDILYEDAEVVVVNKPSGLVVHPAPGNYTGTLVNAILYHCKDFVRPGGDSARPGIVHRLDKDTSGVLVVAKTPAAFAALSEQARAHSFDRRYLALVRGEFKENRGVISASIGRSLADPARMAVTGIGGREAVTRFEVLDRFGVASLLSVELETGRTHQIRVHLRFAGHPVLGDPVYGVTDYASWKLSDRARSALQGLHGQALHAERLGFVHPATGKTVTFTASVPSDFQQALDALRLSRQTQ